MYDPHRKQDGRSDGLHYIIAEWMTNSAYGSNQSMTDTLKDVAVYYMYYHVAQWTKTYYNW